MSSMSPDDRGPHVVEIVRRKNEQLRHERGLGVDKPCVRCIHFEKGNWGWLLPFTVRCTHPVFTEYEVNRVSGQLIGRSRTTPAAARAPGGLCGPDAFLFEERSKWRRFKKWLASKARGNAADRDPAPQIAPPPS